MAFTNIKMSSAVQMFTTGLIKAKTILGAAMKNVPRELIWVAVTVGVLVMIGISVEWFRRHRLQKLAGELGGTFEAGGLLEGVSVPEALVFIHQRPGSTAVTYHNVVRTERAGARLVAADYHYSPSGKNEKSSSCVMVFVSFPEADFADLDVNPPISPISQSLASRLGISEWRPAPPLLLPVTIDGFGEAFEVRVQSGMPRPDAAALARFLPPEAQRELLKSKAFLQSLQVRGNAVCLQATKYIVHKPYRELLDLAESLVEIWRR